MFYLVISVGGALGGLLNGVVAPVLFDGVWEYFLTVALLPVLVIGLPAMHVTARHVLRGVGAAAAVLHALGAAWRLGGLGDIETVVLLSATVVAAVVTWLTIRVAAMLTMTLLVSALAVIVVQERAADLTERTFYGSYRVRSSEGQHHLLHGTTIHGTQFLEADLARTPTTYYVTNGPFGDVMSAIAPDDLAVVGLGAGAIAAYGTEVPRIRFFEIDAAVARIARDQRWFTYLSDSDADVEVVVGDGRLAMEQEPAASFDVVALDAFSSDSIPVHILTREGMEVFLDRVRPDGAVVVHISNRVFDLKPVLAAHARALDLRAVFGRGGEGPGAATSEWVVLTRSSAVADTLEALPRWETLPTDETVDWSDDYSSVLSVLR
jgi:spermidine synthase